MTFITKSEIYDTFIILKRHDLLDTKLTAVNFTNFAQFKKSSSEFYEILKLFIDKRTILLSAWARRMKDLLESSRQVEIKLIKLDKANYNSHAFEFDCLINLSIDLNGFTQDDLTFLINKLAGKKSLFNVSFSNGQHFRQDVLIGFLDKLYDAELIQIENTHTNIKEIKIAAAQFTHRNQLIRALGIKKQPDIWKAIIEKWINTDNNDNNIYYIKPVNIGASSYGIFLERSPEREKKSENKINQAEMRNYEFITLINACVNDMGAMFFYKLLQHLNPQLRINNQAQQRVLVINKQVNADSLAKLVHYLGENSGKLVFAKLSLRVGKEAFAWSESKALLMVLKKSGIQGLILSFVNSLDAAEKSSIATHLKKLVECFNFPLTMQLPGVPGNSLHTFDDLQSILIQKLQKRNLDILFGKISGADDNDEEVELVPQVNDENDLFGKKIRLKSLIKKTNADVELKQDLNNYIKVEVQHTEVLQQIEQVQENIVAHAKANSVATAPALFEGDLVSYNDFFAEPYRMLSEINPAVPMTTYHASKLIASEFFQNIPHNFKFLSAHSAAYIARNLPAFATMNPHNLGQNFVRKRTAIGEIVLDYDQYVVDQQPENPFTPKPTRLEQYAPVYEVVLTQENVSAWIANDELFKAICLNGDKFNHSKITSLWVMYGDVGTKLFFNTINAIDKKHPKFSTFVFNHYLKHFLHWDHFLANQDFLPTLQKINSFDTLRMQCLQKFMLNTGSSRHNLFDTVNAFEFFWGKLTQLCTEQNANINMINATWSTPVGGNPVVYMERLLEILENSRNIMEQLSCLDGIELTSTGAYYAVRNEGFVLVAKQMNLKSDALRAPDLNALPFNPDHTLYRCSLDLLYQNAKTTEESAWWATDAYALSDEEFTKEYLQDDDPATIQNCLATRQRSWLIATSADTLTKEAFLQLKEGGKVIRYQKNKFVHPYKLYSQSPEGNCEKELDQPNLQIHTKDFKTLAYRYLGMQSKCINFNEFVDAVANFSQIGMKVQLLILTSLFFVSHERYKAEIQIKKLFKIIESHTCHQEVSLQTNKHLMLAFKKDIKLSDTEGAVICERIARMNSSEFECQPYGKKKQEYIKKLFDHLMVNKFAVMKALSFFYSFGYNKQPFVFALDTAEYLATEPLIAQAYHEDLIVFGAQINDDWRDSYYHGISSKKAAEITANVAKVKAIMLKAATLPKPNNIDYAMRAIIDSGCYTNYSTVISVFEKITKLQNFDIAAVDAILRTNKFEIHNSQLPAFHRDQSDLRNIMRQITSVLYVIQQQGIRGLLGLSATGFALSQNQDPGLAELNQRLNSLNTVKDLQTEMQTLWQATSSVFLSMPVSQLINSMFKRLRDNLIDGEFDSQQQPSLFALIKERIKQLSNFSDCNNFEKIERIVMMAANIARMLKIIIKRDNYVKEEKEITSVFYGLNFNKIDYDMLLALVAIMREMPQRGYVNILEILTKPALLADKDKFLQIVGYADRMVAQDISTVTIEKVLNFAVNNTNSNLVPQFINELITMHKQDSHDLLLNFVINNLDVGVEAARDILNYRQLTHSANHFAIHELFSSLLIGDVGQIPRFLQELSNKSEDIQVQVLQTVARSYITGRTKSPGVKAINYRELVFLINQLKDEEITLLYNFSQNSAMSGPCLHAALKARDSKLPFSEFLGNFEKAPFGARNLDEQFSTSELERVVNNVIDLNNDTPHTYQFRKQLMEIALFVNDAGRDLPLYNNKPALQLSDLEILERITALKTNKMEHLNSFQKVLFALPLMREAMYRASGEFAYLAQIIAPIDSAMLDGDVLSNIATGQGKGLVDTVKAALLWLFSDCSNATTSSLLDAQLQIEKYGPFLDKLKIPHAAKPIMASSEFADYRVDGVNFGTFSSLSLFLSRARAEGFELKYANNKVSLISNESDHAILDDHTIYRYAITDLAGVGYGDEWIYSAVNEFAAKPVFIDSDMVATKDIKALRNYLLLQAQLKNKSIKLIEKFDDARLLAWIESAIIVQHGLRENFDYVIPVEPVKKVINGVMTTTHTVKILQKDGKVSPDTTYGNGVQQLLCAWLNYLEGQNPADQRRYFAIEMESKTITSTINKNLIEYHQAHNGFIWGSSGTVGSNFEIQEQFKKYGFRFAQIPPHQANIVKIHQPKIFKDEEKQFAAIINKSLKLRARNKNHVSLVFCKDIPTAQRLNKAYEAKAGARRLYEGHGNEAEAVENAGRPGMITITTSALGRNTNILYNRKLGMSVFESYPDSDCGSGQKGGRTGREGSPGDIYKQFNAQDMNGQTPKQVAAAIDAKSAAERNFNEDLYNILGYLLAATDQLGNDDFHQRTKKEFFRENWAQFTDDIELAYRESRLNNSYIHESFVNETIRLFNQMLASVLKKNHIVTVDASLVYRHLTRKVASPALYEIDTKPVKIADCTPSVFIAYSFYPDQTAPAIKSIDKTEIKSRLKKLFQALAKGKKPATNYDYFNYLNANTESMTLIREAHKEFLDDFLNQNIEQANTSWFIKRCFGFVSNLNKIATNQNYLLMFKAMTDINGRQPVVQLPELKVMLINLLEQYLRNSWFVNSSRKKAVAQLLQSINDVTDMNGLITALMQSQCDTMTADIELNKNSFWRKLKPLNYSGNSRYQNTLSDMIVLMSSLTGDNVSATMAIHLSKQLRSLVKKAPAHFDTDKPSIDNLHVTVAKGRFSDASNAQVLANNLEKVLGNDMLFATPIKMNGRPSFFQYKAEVQKSEVTPEQQSNGLEL